MSAYPTLSMQRLLPDTVTIEPGDVLHIAGHTIPALAEQYGTPLYIFDRASIINACQDYWQAFRQHYHASEVKMLYASKAYLAPAIARIMDEQGFGLDVVSAGELLVSQRAAFPLERVSFHGNNKSADELRLAVTLQVGRIVLDNWSELERLTHIAREMRKTPDVLLRVAPDVQTDTHRYLQTGHASAKFGFPLSNGEAKAAIQRIVSDGQLRLRGLHAHTGTMLRETRPYEETLERLLQLAGEAYAEIGWWPEEVSPGGGWGIATADDDATPQSSPQTTLLAQALQQSMERSLAGLKKAGSAPTLIIEPGRSIIARAGVAVYRVGARKVTPGGVTYLFVDGGMADNIRPALYGARYTALPVEHPTRFGEEAVCISGRYCESGDMLIEQVILPYMREGELLLLPTAGAYCLPMASNYNLVPRPAVIIVDDQQVQLIERRETYEDILARYQDA